VKNANSTWLIGHPLADDLERALGRPVRIDNDANCFAVSEASDGAAAGARVVFGVILGTGVGGGLAINGEALVGRMAIAGEWGHNRMPAPDDAVMATEEWPGPPCYCGRRGCVETFLSGPGWLARHRERHAGAHEASAEALVHAMRAGDAAARDSFGRYVDRLARALATVINIVDPDAIVLGGGLSAMSELYEEVPRAWGRYVFSDRVDTQLLPPRHGDSSGVRGAAWLWPLLR
jgi:fructokinase